MSKKIFIIFGHNRYKSGSSFNAAIRDTFIEESKKIGHEIDLVNVYDEKQIKCWDGGGPDEQILDYRKRLEQADIMMVMSPCHNYIMNSATENFIANVLLNVPQGGPGDFALVGAADRKDAPLVDEPFFGVGQPSATNEKL